ncbi:hypothetical protein [Hyphomonas sp.]|uniref:hypothetical protein n=1 Tax=Hyphomonas sp. TaxID=87 RepID=UPI0030FC9328
MTYRVAAAAFAVPALFAAPAAADPVRGAIMQLEQKHGTNTSLILQVGQNSHGQRASRGYQLNQWGQSRRVVSGLRLDALQACRQAVAKQAYRIGYRDVDFDDDRRVRQIGPHGFRVRLDDVEFEGRRRERESDVTCTIRRGHVVNIEGIPAAGRRGYQKARNDRGRGHSRHRGD